MLQFRFRKEFILLVGFCLCLSRLIGQDCSNAQLLCPNEAPPTYTFDDGSVITSAPDSSCLGSNGSVFYSFSTLNIDEFPSVEFSDSSATLQFGVDSCLADTMIGIAILEEVDLCDGSNIQMTQLCEIDSFGGVQFNLNGLSPSTTYQVIVSNLDEENLNNQCWFNLNVSGPAVEYDLEAEGYQEGFDPNSASSFTEIFENETVVLTANDDFEDLNWEGDGLNQTTGNEVTASPGGVGVTVNYIVSTEIEGCTYTDNVSVFILPPIVTSNAFTPNGDGINDTWFIEGIDLWPNAQIFVYSRWGNKVFQGINYQNDWSGDDLPAATYYYIIELNPVDFDADPITGSVTIMR